MGSDVKVERQGNNLVMTSYSPLIQSVEQLLEYTGVLPEDWIIIKQDRNAWTTPSKDIEKDLKYEAGAATGFIKQSNDMRFAQNIQVKVTCVPRRPDKIYPAISPVIAQATLPPVPRQLRENFVRSFIWSDPQFGFRRRVRDAKLIEYHNRLVLDVILQIAEAAGVDRIDILGDWFDASEWTDKFTKSPEFYYAFQPAINESFWWLQQFARIARTRLHEGNHDKRVPDAIKKHLPFAYGLRKASDNVIEAPAVLSIRNLLSLDDIDVEWVWNYPNDRDWLAEKLVLNHGNKVRQGPVETSKAVAKGYLSEIFGHIHREEHSTGVRTDYSGEYEVQGWSFGCTCWTDFRVPGHNPNQDWSNGCGIVDVWPDGSFQVQPISIRNGRGAWNGNLFQARDRVSDLRNDCPEWNW